MNQLYVGIDLGGTNIKLGCFDENMDILYKDNVPTNVGDGPDSIVDRIARAVEDMLAFHNLDTRLITALGIGSPGLIDAENGIVVTTANMGLKNFPLRDLLSQRLHCPVVLENDANIACWAERVAGAGAGCDNMLLLALGTGVGGGIVSDGELVHGWANKAGELGHIVVYPDGRRCGCGQNGCVEAYSSANSTAARALEQIQQGRDSTLEYLYQLNGKITAKDVFNHASKGDPLAIEVTDLTAKALAILCVGLFHFTGPEKIVFFGGMTKAGDLLLDPIKRHFDEQYWTIDNEKPELCLGMLGNDAGIIGSAALAQHCLNCGKFIAIAS
ncbi:MAG: ROK family glucokinase [Phycisphaerae bacterium]|nr:ROK family glucokinase [Phycisphaerae bacterium]